MDRSLQGTVAVVAGGSAGIGLQIVGRFLAEGASVVVGDLQAPPAELASNSRVAYHRTDVAEEADVAALVQAAVAAHGRLDVLVNNAGYGGTVSEVADLDMGKVDTNIAVLLKGPIHGYKHAAAVMKAQRSGSIISTASVAGLVAGAAPLVYSVCKAAVIHLAKCAAIELAPYGVRSNAICPGAIATQLLARSYGVEKHEADAFACYLQELAEEGRGVPRIGFPQDIAQAAVFLASPASRFITGQALAVDGGFSANPATDFGQGRALRDALAAFRAKGDLPPSGA